jgi:hypothetical protein
MARRAILAAISVSGIAVGLFSLHIARSDPSFSFGGRRQHILCRPQPGVTKREQRRRWPLFGSIGLCGR